MASGEPTLRVVPGPGDGLVHARPGILCVIHDPEAAPVQTERLMALLNLPDPAAMTRALEHLVAAGSASDGPPTPDFSVVVGSLNSAVILLHGEMGFLARRRTDAAPEDEETEEIAARGDRPGDLTRHTVDGPLRWIAVGQTPSSPSDDGWSHLQSGTVPGSSAWIVEAGDADEAHTGEMPALPIDEGDAAPAAGSEGTADVIVRGVRCPENHHNNPRASYCSLCGLRMGVSRSLVLVDGPRPPLGVLILDDGSTITVREDMVLGRTPAAHPLVADGSAQATALTDSSRSISRAHLHVRLDEWDVYVSDLGSSNGTFWWDEGSHQWSRLAEGVEVRLEGRTRLHLGQREVVFAPHHVAS